MTDTLTRTMCLTGDKPAASSPDALPHRRELAFIAVERARMPMVVTDPRQPDNPIVLANQAFLDLTGYSAEEVIGQNCRFMQGPETDRRTLDDLREALLGSGEITIELINYRKDGSTFWNQLFISPVHDDDGTLLYYFASQFDISERQVKRSLELEEQRLLREVDHRAKNALALVQGIVRLSRSDDAQAYAAAVQGRVDALARAHSLLADQGWRDVSLERVIRGESEPFGARRIDLDGPEVCINAVQVQPLALMLHEMLSNAAQHGALSAADGSVTVKWHEPADHSEVVIEWVETGGPAPAAERPRGFGTSMIEAIARRQLAGRMTSSWDDAGLTCQIAFPARFRRR